MDSIARFQVCLNLLLASAISFLEIPIPNLFPGVVLHIVKRVHSYIEYGEHDRESVCEEVRSSQYGARDVAEADESSHGESNGSEEDGSVTSGQYEPDGSKDD